MNTTTTPAVGSNSEAFLKELKNDLKALGASGAKGEGSRPMMGLAVCQGAFDGYVKDTHAEELYGSYVVAAAKVAAANPFVTSAGKDVAHSSAKQQISKVRTLIKLGMLPTIKGPDLMRRTVDMIKNISVDPDVKTLSPFDGMLAVARKQIEDPANALTEEEIAGIVIKAEAAEKDTLEKLCAAYKSLVKLDKDLNLPGTAAAADSIADQIKDLGGELPPISKKEKDEASFMQAAKARGFVSMRDVTLYDGQVAH